MNKNNVVIKSTNIKYGRSIPRDNILKNKVEVEKKKESKKKNNENSTIPENYPISNYNAFKNSRSRKSLRNLEKFHKEVKLDSNDNSLIKTFHNKNLIKDSENNESYSVKNFFANKFTVNKNSWYKFSIKIVSGTGYKKGLLKIFGEETKNLVFPVVKLPNIIFTKLDKVNNIDELNQLDDFSFYFKTGDYNIIQLYSVNLNVKFHDLKRVNEFEVKRDISLWRYRRLFDLELINYYIENLNLTPDKTFLERFKSEYQLDKNPYLFENYISNLKVDLKKNTDLIERTNVLYLIHSSIQYENFGYALRTHNLLDSSNDNDYRIYGVTRYGYPYDRSNSYYNDKKLNLNSDIDNVTYLKLLNGEDNYNNNTLEEYLKKYIKETIKLAHNLDAKIIHATTNYWNGIAAIYASKYLGIKSVYEIRGFWEESSIAFNPEIFESDLLKMRTKMEKLVMEKCDKIIVINNILKNDVISKGISEDKIEILSNGVNIDKFKPKIENRAKLIKELNLEKSDGIIGYIGSILNYEGIEYILECVKLLKENHDLNYKFVLIGDGNHTEEILNYAKKIKISNNLIYLGKKDNKLVPQYYDLFDIVIYPRKNFTVCNTTSSSKVIEALSMEKPIIVSDLEAWKDVIINEVTGLYFKSEDVDQLVTQVLRLHTNEELRKTLGENARKWVIENRDWKVIGNKLKDIYKNL